MSYSIQSTAETSDLSLYEIYVGFSSTLTAFQVC